MKTEVLATAKRLGKVEVAHGDTACETPDAAQSIQKVQAWKEAKARKTATSKRTRARA
ncbi:hypothetical protein NR800_23100 [Corallococcus interemptor]|uniref:hypothetical protein n=1 Tax=Corallococcus TaxID=83461 RepID=UPI001CC12B23|nr:hypothetical protein [Corallococcus sp. AS-1-6]MBZ4377444.1 hypothetical protein [Corallococcus sp. AS-1-6]